LARSEDKTGHVQRGSASTTLIPPPETKIKPHILLWNI
jgi:hypothetical protein